MENSLLEILTYYVIGGAFENAPVDQSKFCFDLKTNE